MMFIERTHTQYLSNYVYQILCIHCVCFIFLTMNYNELFSLSLFFNFISTSPSKFIHYCNTIFFFSNFKINNLKEMKIHIKFLGLNYTSSCAELMETLSSKNKLLKALLL